MNTLLLILLLSVFCVNQETSKLVEKSPPGQRITLTDGQMFLPEKFVSDAEGCDLTLHLHGAASTVEPNWSRAGGKGILINVTLKGLSKVYSDKFRDAAVFPRLLKEAGQELERRGLMKEARFRRVTVSSFSAGFGGVRELLKVPETFERIDALVMADSIYSGFVGEPTARSVDLVLMEGFLKFAREAVEGKKRFILSHSQLHTPDYASTVEAADYLRTQLDLPRELATDKWRQDWSDGFTPLYRAARKGLEIYGFPGDTGEDHMKHLRHIGLLLQRIQSLPIS